MRNELDASRRVLRVGSWNVHEGKHKDGYVLYDVWTELAKERLDLACLQEVTIPASEVPKDRKSGWPKQELVNRYLSRVSGFPYVLARALSPSSFYSDSFQAIAILSKRPFVTDPTYFSFPNPEFCRRRGSFSLHDKGAIAASVRFGRRALRVVCLHGFPFHRCQVPLRDEKFGEFVAAIARMLELEAVNSDGGRDLLVAGDFNFEDRADAIPGFAKLRLRSMLDGLATRDSGASHDDLLIGSRLTCDPSVRATNSDHYLITAILGDPKVRNAAVQTSRSRSVSPISQLHPQEPRTAHELLETQLRAPERIFEGSAVHRSG